MAEPMITCPTCKTEIKLTESLASPLIEATRQKYEEQIRQVRSDLGAREAALRDQQAAIEKERDSIDDEVTRKVTSEIERVSAEERRKARAVVSSDLVQKEQQIAELQEVLDERNTKLAEAQTAQADLIRKQRELDDAQRAMELTIETRVQECISIVRDKAKKDAEDHLKLRILEKEHTISSMQVQIEELKRRAEQGSQQLQGEAQELELEAILRAKFPTDMIEPVRKGEQGGDVLQGVSGPLGKHCGTILWEAKRTKKWSDGWLSKVRADQRSAKAEVAVIVSTVLPKGIEIFDFRDGVWVTEPRFTIPVAIVLRQALIEVAAVRLAADGQQSKMELLYQYLTGPRFQQRVQAIVEKFSDMQSDLERERRAMTRLWAKREGQIRGVIESTAGMYGDLQGIAGKSLHEVEGLKLKALEAGAGR